MVNLPLLKLLLAVLLCGTIHYSADAADLTDTEAGRKPVPRSYAIEISISRNSLTLLEQREAGALLPVKEYRVGTVARGIRTYPLGKGKVTAITFHPWWYPTPYSRSVFRERGIELPAAVPPDHPLNYMGPFKISLSHRTRKGAIYRIHGNNDPNRVGRRVTGGCFVMGNEAGLELARTIAIGTEVTIVP